MAATDISLREAKAFTNALFGGKPDHLLAQVWSKSGKISRYYTDLDEAARHAVETVRTDAYIGVSLVSRDLGSRKRGTASDAVCIPGVWADVDVVGGPEDREGKKYAPNVDAAIEVMSSALAPTIIVNSGYGLQGWWLFDEPWVFGSAEERERGRQLAAGWINRIRFEASKRGFTIDATQDLARLMRIPGTLNGKGNSTAPCTGHGEPVFEQDGPHYDVSVVSEHIMGGGESSSTSFMDLSTDFDLTGDVDADLLEACKANMKQFEGTWNRTRRDSAAVAMGDDQSKWDYSLTSQCVREGLDDQQIVSLLIANRKKWGGEDKHATYYPRTINNIRLSIKKAEDEEAQDDALTRLEMMGSNENVDPDQVTAKFSEVVGLPVREIVQSNRDPSSAMFRIVLANGVEVPIGSISVLLNPQRFAEVWAVVTSHIFDPPKAAKWRGAMRPLLKHAQVRDVEVTTGRSQILSWLQDYLGAHATGDHNEACNRRDPFERDKRLWIAPKHFHAYLQLTRVTRMSAAEVEELLSRELGFEQKNRSYKDERTGRRTSTKDYYNAPARALEQHMFDEGGDDDSS